MSNLKISSKVFEFEPDGSSLLVKILEPEIFKTKVDPNILTAPGDPGFVDKGGDQERGVKLAISTKTKVSRAKFVVELTIKKDE